MSNHNGSFHFQAAGKEENPFLIDDSGADMQAQQQAMHHTPQHQGQQQFAGDSQIKVKPSRPPARPPPPQSSKVTSSPCKSAIDDLDAFGSVSANQQPLTGWAFGGINAGGQNQTGIYGSSPQQSAFAQQYSSPAKKSGGVCPYQIKNLFCSFFSFVGTFLISISVCNFCFSNFLLLSSELACYNQSLKKHYKNCQFYDYVWFFKIIQLFF